VFDPCLCNIPTPAAEVTWFLIGLGFCNAAILLAPVLKDEKDAESNMLINLYANLLVLKPNQYNINCNSIIKLIRATAGLFLVWLVALSHPQLPPHDH